MKLEPIERFAAKFIPGSLSECWNWIGRKDQNGYGCFDTEARPNRYRRGHRMMWIFEFGSVPEGMCVLHRCDNPACVNPKHLFLGTHQNNMSDMAFKGRSTKGIKIPDYFRIGLPTEEEVSRFKNLRSRGLSYYDIGVETGWGAMTVWRNLKKVQS